MYNIEVELKAHAMVFVWDNHSLHDAGEMSLKTTDMLASEMGRCINANVEGRGDGSVAWGVVGALQAAEDTFFLGLIACFEVLFGVEGVQSKGGHFYFLVHRDYIIHRPTF